MENSENTLFLRVKDDGIGISEEQVEQLNEEFAHGSANAVSRKRGGIALRNVNSRIRLMFGENYVWPDIQREGNRYRMLRYTAAAAAGGVT